MRVGVAPNPVRLLLAAVVLAVAILLLLASLGGSPGGSPVTVEDTNPTRCAIHLDYPDDTTIRVVTPTGSHHSDYQGKIVTASPGDWVRAEQWGFDPLVLWNRTVQPDCTLGRADE